MSRMSRFRPTLTEGRDEGPRGTRGTEKKGQLLITRALLGHYHAEPFMFVRWEIWRTPKAGTMRKGQLLVNARVH